MVKNNVGEWDTTANNNLDVGGINIAEGWAPSNVNNSIREMMAQIRGFYDAGTATVTTRSGDYTAVPADRSQLLRFTAAATLSLDPASTLGDGWFISVSARGGDLTIDPNASENINGATTITVTDGSDAVIRCDGAAFYSQFTAAPAASTDLVDDTTPQLGGILDANGNQIRWANGGDVGATLNTLTLPDTGNAYNVNSGNSVINEIVFGGTAGATVVVIQFTQVVTLTNSANLVLPGGANILTAPGDYGFFRRAPNGVKHCAFYQRADGTALVQPSTTTPAVEFISSIDFSGESSGNFIGFDAGMYDSYIFDFANVTPATNNAILRVRTSSNGGTSYDSGGSNYQWARSGRLGNIDGNANGSASGILLAAGISSSSNFGLSGRMILTGPHLSARTQVTMQSSYRYGASLTHSVISSSGMRDSSSDVDAIQFSMSTGNISSGTITMYGVRNS